MEDIKNNWNFKDIYKTEIEFNNDIDLVYSQLEKYKGFEGRLNDAKGLFEYFEFETSLSKILSKIYAYAFLQYAQNMKDETNILRYKKVEQLRRKDIKGWILYSTRA